MARPVHGDREVVTRSVEGPIHRTNYRNIRARALKVAQRLERDGIKLGDRVATLGWNTWRHLEVLVRHHGHRRDLPYREPAPVPRADRLDHQSRRRPHRDDRSHLRAAARGDCRRSCRRSSATSSTPTAPTCRRPSSRTRSAYEDWIAEVDGDFAWKDVRREHRGGDVLHLGHHGRPEGRAVLAPLQRAARADRQLRRRARHPLEGRHAAGGAAVPRQQLGHRVLGAFDGHQAGAAGAEARRRLGLSNCSTPRRSPIPPACRRCG